MKMNTNFPFNKKYFYQGNYAIICQTCQKHNLLKNSEVGLVVTIKV